MEGVQNNYGGVCTDMKEAAHAMAGTKTASAAFKKVEKKGTCTEERKSKNQQRNKTKVPSLPPSLALLRGAIILNGAPCYAISVVNLLKKYITDGVTLGSGGEQ